MHHLTKFQYHDRFAGDKQHRLSNIGHQLDGYGVEIVFCNGTYCTGLNVICSMLSYACFTSVSCLQYVTELSRCLQQWCAPTDRSTRTHCLTSKLLLSFEFLMCTIHVSFVPVKAEHYCQIGDALQTDDVSCIFVKHKSYVHMTTTWIWSALLRLVAHSSFICTSQLVQYRRQCIVSAVAQHARYHVLIVDKVVLIVPDNATFAHVVVVEDGQHGRWRRFQLYPETTPSRAPLPIFHPTR